MAETASNGQPTTIANEERLSSKHSHTDSTSASSHQDIEKSGDIDPNVQHGIPVIDTTDDAVEENEKNVISRVVSVTNGNVVDWNDTLDPRRPINWTVKKKWVNCAIIAILTFLTPLASSMAAPAVPIIMEEFKTNDTTIASFIVSIYILGMPLVFHSNFRMLTIS